jgi:galactokinase
VLGAAIDRFTWVALARRSDGTRRFSSEVRPGLVELGSDALERRTGASSWVNYPLGVLVAMQASGIPVPGGFDYMALSNVPAGAGLSSSAAIELASALCSSRRLAQP